MCKIIYFLFIITIINISDCLLYGEVGFWDLQKSDNPLIKEALSLDPDEGINPSKVVNQKREEGLLLQFINENPDSDFIPFIYWRLGYLFCQVNPDYIKAGFAVREIEKSQMYFRKVIDSYPKGKFGDTLMSARVNLAALAPSKAEIVYEYIKYYNWLDEIEKLEPEKRKQMLWFTDYQKKFENYLENADKGLLRNIKGRKNIAAINMVGNAERHPELLKKILDEIPDSNSEPHKLASEKIKLLLLNNINIPKEKQTITQNSEVNLPENRNSHPIATETNKTFFGTPLFYAITAAVSLVVLGVILIQKKKRID